MCEILSDSHKTFLGFIEQCSSLQALVNQNWPNNKCIIAELAAMWRLIRIIMNSTDDTFE